MAPLRKAVVWVDAKPIAALTPMVAVTRKGRLWFGGRKGTTLRTLVSALTLFATPLLAQGSAPAQPEFTAADVRFMQDMIFHHAQAVVMSDWAATHGASPSVLVLAKRIALSQRDEIRLTQSWLGDRHLAVPDPLRMLSKQVGPVHDTSPMNMPDMDMGTDPMIMSGMLTAEQMRQLDAAHGAAFDRLYLQGMIPHHEGAIAMVAQLYASPGGGQQSDISAFANDVDAGQRAEIGRMRVLLQSLTGRQ